MPSTGPYLPNGRCPVRLEVDGVGEHEDRGRGDDAVGEQCRDQALGSFADPRVDRVAAGVGIAGEVEGDDVGAVVGGEQIDPRLLRFDVEAWPDAIGERDRHLLGLGRGQLLVDAVPRLVCGLW